MLLKGEKVVYCGLSAEVTKDEVREITYCPDYPTTDRLVVEIYIPLTKQRKKIVYSVNERCPLKKEENR